MARADRLAPNPDHPSPPHAVLSPPSKGKPMLRSSSDRPSRQEPVPTPSARWAVIRQTPIAMVVAVQPPPRGKPKMAKNLPANPNARHPIRSGTALLTAMAMCLALALPGIALGQDVTDTIATTCGFASSVNKILNAISIIVVTIAIVFSGYQI